MKLQRDYRDDLQAYRASIETQRWLSLIFQVRQLIFQQTQWCGGVSIWTSNDWLTDTARFHLFFNLSQHIFLTTASKLSTHILSNFVEFVKCVHYWNGHYWNVLLYKPLPVVKQPFLMNAEFYFTYTKNTFRMQINFEFKKWSNKIIWISNRLELAVLSSWHHVEEKLQNKFKKRRFPEV